MMGESTRKDQRHFVFLQGPHGPFFASLAKRFIAAGHRVSRVTFNAGDAAFWRRLPDAVDYQGDISGWVDWFDRYCKDQNVTDLVCYGASRPIHADASVVAAKRNITSHVLEEGYLRPYWVTYERGGTNALSPAMDISIGQMAEALSGLQVPLQRAPDRWGDMRQHMFWGTAYHAALLAGQHRYKSFTPHRMQEPKEELAIYLRHFLTLPRRRIQRRLATRRVLRGAFAYHVVLMQLAHDANFRDNGPFWSQETFVDAVMQGFSKGAPKHHHLVFKAHPFEDGREPLPAIIKAL